MPKLQGLLEEPADETAVGVSGCFSECAERSNEVSVGHHMVTWMSRGLGICPHKCKCLRVGNALPR